MSKTKLIQLEKPMTWAGVNYAPGLNTMPEAAANYAVKKKFGSSGKSADFQPLPLRETMERMGKADFSDDVLESLKHYQPVIAEAQEKGISPEELFEERNAAAGGGKSDGLPTDFPMEHIFSKPNKLSESGFKTVAEIQAFTRDELVSIDGIGAGSADKALAYGK